jgi:predicted transglutaminase-like cysteine proteinase
MCYQFGTLPAALLLLLLLLLPALPGDGCPKLQQRTTGSAICTSPLPPAQALHAAALQSSATCSRSLLHLLHSLAPFEQALHAVTQPAAVQSFAARSCKTCAHSTCSRSPLHLLHSLASFAQAPCLCLHKPCMLLLCMFLPPAAGACWTAALPCPNCTSPACCYPCCFAIFCRLQLPEQRKQHLQQAPAGTIALPCPAQGPCL